MEDVTAANIGLSGDNVGHLASLFYEDMAQLDPWILNGCSILTSISVTYFEIVLD